MTEFDFEQFRQQNLDHLHENVTYWAAKERAAHQKAVQAFEDAGSNLSSFERSLLLQGAAWQRQQEWEPHLRDTVRANPVLEEAIHYFMERQGMANPKGWEHVLRVVQQRKPEDFKAKTRPGPATQAEYDEAIAALRTWIVADKVDTALASGA